MAIREFIEYVLRMVFSALIISNINIFGLSMFDGHAFFLLKFFRASEEAVNETISNSGRADNSGSRKLNLLEIITNLFWYHKIAEAGHSFIWAIIPKEYQQRMKAYEEFKGPRKTPSFIKELLSPHETAEDFAENFTRRVLVNLGFHNLSSSSLSTCYLTNKYPGCNDSRVSLFERVLSQSCFARELVKRYNSIDFYNNGLSPNAPTMFTDLEKRILRGFYFIPNDDKWIEPMNNWFDWYIKTIHKRIFKSQDFQVFEATVKFLLFAFLHDTTAPFICLFDMFGIS